MIQPQRRVRVKKVDRDKTRRVKRRRWKVFESQSVLVPIEKCLRRGERERVERAFRSRRGIHINDPQPGVDPRRIIFDETPRARRKRTTLSTIPRRVGRHHSQRMSDLETRFPFPDLVVRPEKRPCSQKRRKARTHQDEMKTRRDRRDERDGDGKGERRGEVLNVDGCGLEVKEEERLGMGRCESVVGLGELGDIHRARPREAVTESSVECGNGQRPREGQTGEER